MKLIGTTETYDPCYVNDWDNRLLEANIIITKQLTDQMIEKLVDNSERIILHHTVTGFGGTKFEPGVNDPHQEYLAAVKLFESGFPVSHYVLRVDPIITIGNLWNKALNLVLPEFSKLTSKYSDGSKMRCRVSLIDYYPHVKIRFSNLGVNLINEPFTNKDYNLVKEIEDYLQNYSRYFEFESCAEPQFNKQLITPVGCTSSKDLELLGVSIEDYHFPDTPQRSTCHCLAKKQILGVKPGRCPHKCIYCYWKD